MKYLVTGGILLVCFYIAIRLNQDERKKAREVGLFE